MTIDYMKDFYFRNLEKKNDDEVQLPAYLDPFEYKKENEEEKKMAFDTLKNGEYDLEEEE